MKVKRIISCVLAAISLVCAASAAFAATADVNGDGKVTAKDATVLLKLIASGQAPSAQYDVNGDGKVTAKDASAILKQIASGGKTPEKEDKVYGEDLLGLTFGQIKSKFGVKYGEFDTFQGAIYVPFIKDGKTWNIAAAYVPDNWDTLAVPDSGKPALIAAVEINPTLRVGMTYQQILAAYGSANVSELYYLETDGCYVANIGCPKYVVTATFSDPNGKCDSLVIRI